MYKSKNIFLNAARISVLCGVALLPLQSAFAMWDEEILEAKSIDIKALKTKCIEGVKAAKDNTEKSQWKARGDKLVELGKKANTMTLVQQKFDLLEGNMSFFLLGQANPTVLLYSPENVTGKKKGDGLSLKDPIKLPEDNISNQKELVNPPSESKEIKKAVKAIDKSVDEKNGQPAQTTASSNPKDESTTAAISTNPLVSATTEEDDEKLMKEFGVSSKEDLNKLREQMNAFAAKKTAPIVTNAPVSTEDETIDVPERISLLMGFIDASGDTKEDTWNINNWNIELGKLQRALEDGHQSIKKRELDYYMLKPTVKTEALVAPLQEVQPAEEVPTPVAQPTDSVAAEIENLKLVLKFPLTEEQKAQTNARLRELEAKQAPQKL